MEMVHRCYKLEVEFQRSALQIPLDLRDVRLEGVVQLNNSAKVKRGNAFYPHGIDLHG